MISSARSSVDAISAALAYAVAVLEEPHGLTGLKTFDAGMQALVARVEPGSCQLQGDWLADRRLLTMYSPGIQQK